MIFKFAFTGHRSFYIGKQRCRRNSFLRRHLFHTGGGNQNIFIIFQRFCYQSTEGGICINVPPIHIPKAQRVLMLCKAIGQMKIGTGIALPYLAGGEGDKDKKGY